jgi:ABC-2 type transport system ATP-binding protein
MVRGIAREGTTILYTTHYLHEAEDLCERIAIIDHGRILAEGTLAELRAAVGERDLVTVRGRFEATAVQALVTRLNGAVEMLSVKEDEIVLASNTGGDSFGRLVRGFGELGDPREISLRQPSLENLFIKLTGRELRE